MDRATSRGRPPGWGVDLPDENRPGVPMEATPRRAPGAHWTEPERQPETVTVLKRADLDRLTPVFGTAEPPRGLSGLLRRAAYAIPDHTARHWMLLLFADRVDVVETRLRGAAKPAAVAVGLVGAAFLVRAALRRM